MIIVATSQAVLEFLNNYGGQEPSRKRVLVPARQATEAGGIDSLESISGLHRSLKIPPHYACRNAQVIRIYSVDQLITTDCMTTLRDQLSVHSE